MSENDWKRFVENWQAAEAADRELVRKNPPSREQVIAWSLELLNIREALHGNPFVKDEITLKEEEEVRRTWDRLRERWRRAG